MASLSTTYFVFDGPREIAGPFTEAAAAIAFAEMRMRDADPSSPEPELRVEAHKIQLLHETIWPAPPAQ
ncbi:MAG: hypothetical protein D6692_01730 [Planctomycetota bacterium]|nr:MAG: hypothetical protein D6692_01730 [Planctomycetota bacterium]